MHERLSQREQVIMHLDAWYSITPQEAISLYGIYRLAAIIFNLKKEGYKIKKDMHYTGRKRRYAEYYLGE